MDKDIGGKHYLIKIRVDFIDRSFIDFTPIMASEEELSSLKMKIIKHPKQFFLLGNTLINLKKVTNITFGKLDACDEKTKKSFIKRLFRLE